MIEESTNAQSGVQATSITAELHKTAEVPNSVATSPQPANSAVDEEESKQTNKSDDKEEQKQEQQTPADEENEEENTVEVKLPHGTATDDTEPPINGTVNAKDKDDKDELDDDGDHVVEGDEDDVIY